MLGIQATYPWLKNRAKNGKSPLKDVNLHN